jgi:L-ascorbate metabolism protein UlaG (beta-lactamase superfamily)
MDDATPICLSPYVVPALYMGEQPFSCQNMIGGADRLSYLDGLLEHVHSLLARGFTADAVREFLAQVPMGGFLLEVKADGAELEVRERAQVRDAIAFRSEHLTTLFLDGRQRRVGEMVALNTGEPTAAFSSMVSHLARGGLTAELIEQGNSLGLEIDREFLAGLSERRVIEAAPGLLDGPAFRRSPQFRQSSRFDITWLGHAAAMLRAGETIIWVDPYLFPAVQWRPEELDTHFSLQFADSVLLDPYGPETAPISPWELPPPDAILITHQDIDHFAPGILMSAPESTQIIVPAAHPESGLDIDLGEVARTLFGERRIIRLSHGECVKVGQFDVTAFPFSGEVPANMMHRWNCYWVEAAEGAVAFCADSTVDAPQLEFLAGRKNRSPHRPAMLMARGRFPGAERGPGYRDQPDDVFSASRLWGWYCQAIQLFAPTMMPGVSAVILEQLRREAGVEAFFPYASGSLPWLRFESLGHPLNSRVGSLDLLTFRRLGAMAGAAGMEFVPLKYGVPHPLG